MAAKIISEIERKKTLIDTLYHHSDLSVEAISNQVDMSVGQVQNVIDKIRKRGALEVLVEQSKTPVEQIMTKDVVSLDCSSTVYDAAEMMSQKKTGCVVVTDDGEPFGILTERDIVWGIRALDTSFKKVTLDEIASRPIVYAEPKQTIEEVADIMAKEKIRRLPVVSNGKVVGIVTVTDLARFLSPTRRPGLADSILHAISRETAARGSR